MSMNDSRAEPSGQSYSAHESLLDSALRHVRMAKLTPAALSLYIALWRAQSPVGRVDPGPALEAIKATAGGSAALKELERHDLISAEASVPGLWIVHPDTLDAADAFASGRVP
jgi:hypothetical protein